MTDLPWPLLLAGLEFPAAVAMIDCLGRPDHHFAGGKADKQGWIKWLVVAIVTVPILVGFLLLVGYYHSVVRRNSPFSGR